MSKLDYRSAGVNIDAGNALVERIKPAVLATLDASVLTGIGGFGAVVEIPPGMRQPVLISGADGVGTKLLLAQSCNQHTGIGIDLVAMCVNDILVQGARPLFFLDYYACGKLDVEQAAVVVESIAVGCLQAGCALVGGETAEMPGMYATDHYDLAGFSVGIAEREQLITGAAIRAGDVLIGIASSGPHSNGYSLIRRIIEVNGTDLQQPLDQTSDKSLAAHLLEPTIIYVKQVLQLLDSFSIHGMAHITGGGLTENIVRVVPEHLGVEINMASWPRPAIFSWLQNQGAIDEPEMRRTFNCGIGFVLIVDRADLAAILSALDLPAWHIGIVTTLSEQQPRVNYLPA